MVWQQWQHLIAFYQSPIQHWEKNTKNPPYKVNGFLLSLLILPALLLLFSTTLLGWQVGDGHRHFLTFTSASKMTMAMICLVLIGTLGFAWTIHKISAIFGSKTHYIKCVNLVIYSGSPLLLSSLSVLSTQVWVVMCMGLIGTAYSILLLHKGIPIVMAIPLNHAFICSTLLITCGSIILIATLTVTVMLWAWGISPHLVLL